MLLCNNISTLGDLSKCVLFVVLLHTYILRIMAAAPTVTAYDQKMPQPTQTNSWHHDTKGVLR